MLLFKKCEVYRPEYVGRRDVLVGGSRILAVEDDISGPVGPVVTEIAADGLRLVPGLIDNHVHIAGAGGEGGPATRTPEMHLGQMLDGGITTVIGCLGTDGMTRSVECVLMKAKALRAEGVSCWIYTGAYQVPTPTILGDVGRDLALIEEVIGVGEIAIADHRSSGPSRDELIRLAGHARVGGLLGGKAGVVNLHMGDARNPFHILYDVVAASELKPTRFLPTHCNRNVHIFEDAKIFGRDGYVDFTTSSWAFYPDDEIKPSRAVAELVGDGVPLSHITMSSDGCGSLPQFDAHGRLVKMTTGEPRSLFDEMRDLAVTAGWSLESALQPVTSTVADILKLPRKGRIAEGMDADMVLLDDEFAIHHLVANGTLMIRDGRRLCRGTFEPEG